MTGTLDDALRAHRAGEPHASGKLVEHCLDRIAFLSTRLLPAFPIVARWDRPSDIAQDVSLRLLDALQVAKPENERHLLALASKKVREELVDRVRRYRGEKRGLDRLQSQGDVPLAENAAHYVAADDVPGPVTNEKWDSFWNALDTLPPDQRSVFDAKWFLDASEATIAEMLNTSRSTVQRLWSDAKAHIKSRCGEMPG